MVAVHKPRVVLIVTGAEHVIEGAWLSTIVTVKLHEAVESLTNE